MATNSIAYLLSLPKLNRLIADHGTGNNALQISMEQTITGEFQLRASFIKVPLRPGVPGETMSLPENDGSELLCPVPPGCDENGNCKKRKEDHMVGSASAYTVELNRGHGIESSQEYILKITPQE